VIQKIKGDPDMLAESAHSSLLKHWFLFKTIILIVRF